MRCGVAKGKKRERPEKKRERKKALGHIVKVK